MPEIKGYTRQVQPSQMIQARANPDAFGADQTATLNQAEALSELSGVLQEAVVKRNSREDVINKTRAAAQFNEEVEAEYLRTTTEQDLVDPNSGKTFNNFVRQKAQEYITNFQGSEDARAELEAKLIGLQSNFVSQMNLTSFNAQQNFVSNAAMSGIDQIAGDAYKNPADVEKHFKTFNEMKSEYRDALDDDAEAAIDAVGNAKIAESAINSFIDSGRYEDANKLLSNIVFLENLPADKQRALIKQVDDALAHKTRLRAEMNDRKTRLDIIESSGIKLTDESRAQYLLGSTDIKQDVRQKVATMSSEGGITEDQALAVADPELYKTLQEVKGDPNKERTPSGDFTEKGIAANIATDIKPLELATTNFVALESSVEEFKRTGNRAAVMAAITGFKKAFDPTSAVMEGEIRLQQEAQSWAGSVESFLNKGQALGTKEVEDLIRTAESYLTELRNASKPIIDGHIKEAERLNYRRYNIQMPNEKYYRYFGTYETGKTKKSIYDLSDEELMGLAE